MIDDAYGDRYDRIWDEVYGDIQDLGPAHRHIRRLLARTLADLDYEDALDVGCGAGHNLGLLATGSAPIRVTGVDLSARALQRARERFPAAELIQADVERAPVAGRWDLVFSALLLEHLDDDEAALRHLRGMTSRHLVLVTIAGDFDRYRRWERRVGHVRNYRPGELEDKLGRAGFRDVETTHWGFPFYSPIARSLQNRLPPRSEYGAGTALVARLAYLLYRLNSSRRGDVLIARAAPG
jgi:SAM-dependent methyltransferase